MFMIVAESGIYKAWLKMTELSVETGFLIVIDDICIG